MNNNNEKRSNKAAVKNEKKYSKKEWLRRNQNINKWLNCKIAHQNDQWYSHYQRETIIIETKHGWSCMKLKGNESDPGEIKYYTVKYTGDSDIWKNQWLWEPLCRPSIETNIIWEPFTNKHKKMWDVRKASRAEAAIGKTKFRWMHLIIPCSRIASRQRIQILRKNLNTRHWIVPLEDRLVE